MILRSEPEVSSLPDAPAKNGSAIVILPRRDAVLITLKCDGKRKRSVRNEVERFAIMRCGKLFDCWRDSSRGLSGILTFFELWCVHSVFLPCSLSAHSGTVTDKLRAFRVGQLNELNYRSATSIAEESYTRFFKIVQ